MGYPDRKCFVFIFRYPRRRYWAGEYPDVSVGKNLGSNHVFFSGISSSEHNLCGNWCSPSGQCPSRSPCAANSDAHGPQAAKDATVSHDKLIDLFNRVERFFRRLESYTRITPTTAMTEMIIEIMVEVLNVLAIATKEVKCGRLSKLISRARYTILG